MPCVKLKKSGIVLREVCVVHVFVYASIAVMAIWTQSLLEIMSATNGEVQVGTRFKSCLSQISVTLPVVYLTLLNHCVLSVV